MGLTQSVLGQHIYIYICFYKYAHNLVPEGVPRHDFECILVETLCVKSWDSSRGLKPTKLNLQKQKNNNKNATQNAPPRTPARPPERGFWEAAAPRKKRCV